MTPGLWKFGHWKRIPFFFHWTILLWLPWYGWQHRSIVWACITLLAFTALLLAHELGHAIVARARRTKVYNIRLYLLHGLCEHETPYYEEDDLFIACGGVLAQLVVLGLALVVRYGLQLFAPSLAQLLAPLFFVFINANILMAVINLIPVAPLDGHKAWRALPLLPGKLRPRLKRVARTLLHTLNLKRRRAAAKESQRVSAELFDRLKNRK